MEEKVQKLPEFLPILPVRDSVIFPRMVVPLMIRDEEYVRLVDEVLQKDKLLVVAMIVDPDADQRPPNVHRVGTAGMIVKLTKTEEGTILV
ncbi:MAG TPA: endopeptidase La, partial [Desulfobacterales bacterium]|nr:endopeptidase La [Desulfobacterales bacterium]